MTCILCWYSTLVRRHKSQPSNFLLWYGQDNKRLGPLGLSWKIGPERHGCLLRPCGFLRARPFWPKFPSHFWLKVNNDTVFKASLLKYEPLLRVGARSRHRYLESWQHLKISIYCWGKNLHLTKNMNYHMVDSFSSKGWVLIFCQKMKHFQSKYVL